MHRLPAPPLLALACAGLVLNQVHASNEVRSLRLAVPSALPVVGERQVLKAILRPQGPDEQKCPVRFTVRGSKLDAGTLGVVPFVPAVESGDWVAECPWTPDGTGDFTLAARWERPRTGQAAPETLEAAQHVIAVRRRLQIHHWSLRPELQCVTEGMVNRTNLLQYWADRGVMAQRWRSGRGLWKRMPDMPPPERLSRLCETWLAPRREGFPGIVIDEFGGLADAIDQSLGDALLLARQREPSLFMAAYCIGVGGQRMIDGLKAADRVLVECYAAGPAYRDGRWDYTRIRARYGAALDAGLSPDKTLAALSLGKAYGIVTPQELRRQLHVLRFHFPAAPGVALFGDMAEPLDLDVHLRRFFIGPVLRVAPTDDGRLRISNIGGDDAPAARITLLSESNAANRGAVNVPALAVDEIRVVELPDGIGTGPWIPATEFQPGLTTLGPPLLGDREPEELRPGATQPWPPLAAVAVAVTNLLASPPLSAGENPPPAPTALRDYAIPATKGRSFQLAFDWQTTRDGFANIAVRLSDPDGQASLTLRLGRGQQRPAANFAVALRNADGLESRESLPTGIRTNVRYRLCAYYDAGRHVVRVGLHDEAGVKRWDTGEVPAYGPLEARRLTLSASAGRGGGGSLDWEPDRRAMRMRGVGGQAGHALEGSLSRLELLIFAPRQTDVRALPGARRPHP